MLTARRSNLITLSFAALACVVAPLSELTADETCHHCGECGHTKYKLCLVRVDEEVQLPQYRCEPQTVYCPSKAPVAHYMQRCDQYLRLDKCVQTPMPCVETCTDGGNACNCDSHGCETPACGGHAVPSPPPTWAGQIYYRRSTRTTETCGVHYGACPSGQHVTANVATPTDEPCRVTVPVMRWVRVPVCDSCCSRGGGH